MEMTPEMAKLIPDSHVRHFGPKRLRKAQGITLDPKTKQWKVKHPKKSPDPLDRKKLVEFEAEVKARPMPPAEKPFDWSRYSPLPGRTLLKIGREIVAEKGIVIPENARKAEEWLTVLAIGGAADFKVGDRVLVTEKAHRLPITVNGNTDHVLVKSRYVVAVMS